MFDGGKSELLFVLEVYKQIICPVDPVSKGALTGTDFTWNRLQSGAGFTYFSKFSHGSKFCNMIRYVTRIRHASVKWQFSFQRRGV